MKWTVCGNVNYAEIKSQAHILNGKSKENCREYARKKASNTLTVIEIIMLHCRQWNYEHQLIFTLDTLAMPENVCLGTPDWTFAA